MMNSVSVVIPTFNSAHFISSTIQSVLMQTRPPNEIIVSDDNSVDGTLALVDGIAKSSTLPIRVVETEINSGGPARPLNRGIAAATSKFIATLDHDDLMLPTKLERSIDCLRATPDLGLLAALCFIPEVDGKVNDVEQWQAAILRSLRISPPKDNFALLDRRAAYGKLIDGNFLLTCSNMVFPRETWRSIGGFPENLRLAIDYDFLRRCLETVEIGFLDEYLTIWTARPDSLFRTARSYDKGVERLRILSEFERRALSLRKRRSLKVNIKREALAAACYARNHGNYKSAASFYLDSIRLGGLNTKAIAGLAKLLTSRILTTT